jgi:hypothetical protein
VPRDRDLRVAGLEHDRQRRAERRVGLADREPARHVDPAGHGLDFEALRVEDQRCRGILALELERGDAVELLLLEVEREVEPQVLDADLIGTRVAVRIDGGRGSGFWALRASE